MYHMYSLLLTLGFVVLLPRFLVDALRHGKYVAGFRERFGSLVETSTNKPVIWLHCVSVGETQAARPLADLLSQKFPQYSLVVSTITLTGQNLAREIFQAKATRVFYFPFDWRWSVRRTLRAIKPTVVLLMETELWPNFLHECDRAHVPVVLINGRISAKSERRYRMVRGFLKEVVGDLTMAIMQAEADKERLQQLGMPSEKLFVCGSLKFDAVGMPPSSLLAATFRQRFGLNDSDVGLILAASTHAPEERILLESFQILAKKQTHKLKMMIAPRHPERFSEVASLIQRSGLSWARRSSADSDSDRRADVILLDTIGELPAVYPLAKVVFVGGSIANFGGHNILEPAAVGGCIITGAHTHNFQAIVKEFVQARAILQLPAMTDREMVVELSRTLEAILSEPDRCEALRRRAALLVQQNQGATERTLKLLEPLLMDAVAQNHPATLAAGTRLK